MNQTLEGQRMGPEERSTFTTAGHKSSCMGGKLSWHFESSKCEDKDQTASSHGCRASSSESLARKSASTPKLDISDLKLGQQVGNGAFGEVLEVKSVSRRISTGIRRRLSSIHDIGLRNVKNRRKSVDTALNSIVSANRGSSWSDKVATMRGTARKVFVSNKLGTKSSQEASCPPYVLKRVRRTYSRPLPDGHIKQAMIDLSNEAMILSTLRHPNIISLRAMSSSKESTDLSSGDFLVLDRLHGTLSDRLHQWEECEKRIKWKKRLFGALGRRFTVESRRLLSEKLAVARDISEALEYLHSRNILYRDLKPHNIGFHKDGTLKIFDFGLAVDVTEKAEKGAVPGTGEPLFALEGGAGSPRYMAPEVALHRPYNFKADVYSFGILLWQILTLRKPFNGFNKEQHLKLAMRGGLRPPMSPCLESSVQLKYLLQSCWSTNIALRPDFATVRGILDEQIRQLQEE